MEQGAAPPGGSAQRDNLSTDSEIVIIGKRLFQDIVPERSVDERTIWGYGAGTVEDLIAELMGEMADEDGDVVFMVNGERVENLDEVAGYPVEALQSVEVLPRGSGTRVGAPANRRVYNITLRRQVQSATLAVAPRVATDGDWNSFRGEAILTRVRGPFRVNLSLRALDESSLLESDRWIIQPEQRAPFDLRGNIIADPRAAGDEIDPLLSALAGGPVNVAGVPIGTSFGLEDFARTANIRNLTDLGAFRTLRPDSRRYEANISIANRLAPWLNSSLTGRLDYMESTSLIGLPGGIFILPQNSSFSPFTRDVAVARFGSTDPMQQRYSRLLGNVNLRLNGSFGKWQVTLAGRHQHSDSRYDTERQDFSLTGPVILDPARNPFEGEFRDLLPITLDRSVSLSSSSALSLMTTGSPVQLPAGGLQTTLEGQLLHSGINARSSFSGTDSTRRLDRTEKVMRGALTIPLASRREGFLPWLGELSANLDSQLSDINDQGSFHSWGYGLTWQPQERFRTQAWWSGSERPPGVEALGDAVVATPVVPTFDLLRGETVETTWISGGNPNLVPQETKEHRITASYRAVPSINLLLTAEYARSEVENFVSTLPPASVAVMLAFPDRFIRDDNGRLIVVDMRPVNFARSREERLRYGFNFSVPLGGATAARQQPDGGDMGSGDGEEAIAPPIRTAGGTRTRLQVSANHSIILVNDILIRPGVPVVDLLDGGAIGIGGGRNRHQLDFAIGVAGQGVGARLAGNWRSQSLLETRATGAVDTLRFAPLATVNLRAFAEGQRLLPSVPWLSRTRFSVSVVNLFNERQLVKDTFGNIPLRYQQGYRDALGRTIEFEIRTVFPSSRQRR